MTDDLEEFYLEECPLTQQSIPFPPFNRPGHGTTSNSTISKIFSGKKHLKGPLRVLRLCVLGILLPCMLAVCVLYLRYRVYVEQLYPLAVSDMRMLDNRVSTTWCQCQRIRLNNSTKFNAYLLPKSPTLATTSKPLSMVRHLHLEDDTKEYWGFYLLRGSTVTISTCARWPGASLIVIRGHKHLHECAYIGDDSSEELDELMEAIEEGTYVNSPDKMKRHREEVEFHHPDHKNTSNMDENHKLKQMLDTSDITDSVMLKKILQQLYEKASRHQGDALKEQKDDERLAQRKVMEDHMHVHRNSTIAKGEKVNITSQNVVNLEVKMLEDEARKQQEEAAFKKNQEVTHNNHLKDSEELVQQVLSQLGHLGDRGQKILTKAQQQMKLNQVHHQQLDQQHKLHEVAHNGLGPGLAGPPEEAVTMGGRKYSKPPVKYDDNIDREARRRRRDIVIGQVVEGLSDGEEDNNAAEEDFVAKADGIADHHAVIDETTLNDMSNSEFWSSFSSSEEALLNCAGLILNLPLTPHHQCSPDLTEDQVESAYLANTITYKVPVNGYYFFVFNSENEIQPNYIRVRFNIEKTVYNVTQTVSQCANSTAPCALDLAFFSDQVVVMELPVQEDQDLWNTEFVVVSVCEPRTALYVFLVISVPVLVIVFAFQ